MSDLVTSEIVVKISGEKGSLEIKAQRINYKAFASAAYEPPALFLDALLKTYKEMTP